MAQYVDGFVVPVPEDKLDAYLEMAREAGRLWREYGALEFRECVADDVKVGEVTSFPEASRSRRARPWSFRGSSSSRASIATASTPR